MLAPNKQNLLILEKQLKTIENGHKLLKEKRSGLIITFIDKANQGKKLEAEVAKELSGVIHNYKQSTLFTSLSSLVQEFSPEASFSIRTTKRRLSGVYVFDIESKIKLPKHDNLKNNIAQSLNNFALLFPKLLSFTQLKLTCEKLSEEIIKTNRQIANIENRIQDVKAQIKFIANSLVEKSNFEKATLIKIFN